MSKNAGRENSELDFSTLVGEMEKDATPGSKRPAGVVLARLISGLTREEAKKHLEKSNQKGWQVIPLASRTEVGDWEEWTNAADVPITPFRETYGILTSSMFFQLIQRELLRMKRGGGCLSVVGAGLQDRERVASDFGETAANALEALLGSVILSRLDKCDSVGVLRRGQYLCCLPGMGQLAARDFAETVQKTFGDAASEYVAKSGKSDLKAICALGIVNVLQGDNSEATALLNRARQALEMAFTKSGNRIHQENSFAPLENTTLVHSSEKKFLFFGGNAS